MKYFDKVFFKFTLGFLLIITISLLIIIATNAYAAEVEKIVFTTEAQSIKPNELSGPITIQTQDASEASFPTPETMDLTFFSTSAGGEFLGSTGNAVGKTMSVNTANRTFYYRDSAEGNFTITINAKGRTSLKEWSASQAIIVSGSATPPPPPSSSGEVAGASTNSSDSTTQSGGGSSYRVTSPNTTLEMYPLVDRVTSLGSPITFQGIIKKNTTDSPFDLNWSYGDGNVGVGRTVNHAYKYPGDYVVVLSVRAGETFSVNRFKVKVIEPDIKVKIEDGYIEILNNGSTEINLFNWKIENAGYGFMFQPDTILLPHSSLKLEKALLKMKGEDNSKGMVLKNYFEQEVVSIPEFVKIDNVEINKKIDSIKGEALIIQNKLNNLGLVSRSISVPIPEVEVKAAPVEIGSQIGEMATEDLIYEAPQKEGFISQLTNLIKRVFSN